MKISLVILITLFSISSSAQFIKPKEVPVKIKSVLDSIYPSNKFPVWKMTGGYPYGRAKYIATFTENHIRNWVVIDSFGYFLSYEKDFNIDSLPLIAIKYIDTHYERKLIFCIRKMLISNRIYFFVGLRGTRLTYELLFDETGNTLKDKNNFLRLIANALIASTALSPILLEKYFRNYNDLHH